VALDQVRTGLLVSAIVAALGCGGAPADDGDTSAADTPAATDASTPATPREACRLVDVSELAAIAGQPLTAVDVVRSSNETACELRGGTGTEPLIDVAVQWTGGRDQARAMGGGMAMATDLLNEPGIDIEELTGSGSEPGLADDAFYSNLMPSWVLKGDVLIQVMSPMFDADRTRRTFLAIARTAPGRL